MENFKWEQLDFDALLEELERESPGITERVAEIREQMRVANQGVCIGCRTNPTLAKMTDHSCGDCEDVYDWYCWRCANGMEVS